MRPPKKVERKLKKKETPPKGGRAMERVKQFKEARESEGEACETPKGGKRASDKKSKE